MQKYMLFIKQKSNSCFFVFLFQMKIYKQHRKTTYVISFLNLRETVNNILHNSKETETETERNKLGALMME